ncbi:MAG: DUF5134 domain-containing protein [Mycobacterium sp.]
MIQDPVLRWIVTVLFVLTAAQILYAITVGHLKWPHIVGHLLHFTMSVAMAVMAWPRGAALTTPGSMVFFVLAAVWFVAVTLAGAGSRIVNGYSALMMVAMAWMYAVMGGMTGSSMDGMDGMDGMDASSSHGGHPGWVGAVNWIWTIFFAAAALCWIGRYVSLRKAGPPESEHRSLDAGWQAMMATGMAMMFGVAA